MLEQLFKEKAKVLHREVNDSSALEDIQSVKSWIRKIEQTASSISARLCAIEKRLALQPLDPETIYLNGLSEEQGNGKEKKKLRRSKKNVERAVQYFDTEIQALYDEIAQQKNDVVTVQTTIDDLNKTIQSLYENDQRQYHISSDVVEDFDHRLENLERKEPLTMHLGTWEIPIEFSGLITGILAFLIALLVIFDEKEIILSPFFLCAIGSVFISAALVKTLYLSKRLRRNNLVLPHTAPSFHNETRAPTQTSQINDWS